MLTFLGALPLLLWFTPYFNLTMARCYLALRGPDEEVPGEEMPNEEAHVEEIPVEEIPVEEIPALEEPKL